MGRRKHTREYSQIKLELVIECMKEITALDDGKLKMMYFHYELKKLNDTIISETRKLFSTHQNINMGNNIFNIFSSRRAGKIYINDGERQDVKGYFVLPQKLVMLDRPSDSGSSAVACWVGAVSLCHRCDVSAADLMQVLTRAAQYRVIEIKDLSAAREAMVEIKADPVGAPVIG